MANNPATNVSKLHAKQVADTIYKFYVIETNEKYAAHRRGALKITGVEARTFPDIFSYPPFYKSFNKHGINHSRNRWV